MPITITLPNSTDGSWIGPGATISGQTSVIGPLPSDTQWNYEVFPGSDEVSVWTEHLFQAFNPSNTTLQVRSFDKSTTRTKDQPVDGQQVRLVVELQTSSGIIDTGSVTTTWRSTRGLGQQAFLMPATTASGGFNDNDRAALGRIDSRTTILGEQGSLLLQTASGPITTTLAEIFSRQTLDRLTLAELTAGETPDPVRVLIDEHYFGVIIRTTTIADDLVPKTPDANWYFPDLAVLRIFRGADLEERHGVHTPTYMQYRPWAFGWNFLNAIPVLGLAAEREIAVDWRLGCAGRVFLMRYP